MGGVVDPVDVIEKPELGGINKNMVLSWPARIKAKVALRERFVIDVVRTILQAGISARPRSSTALSKRWCGPLLRWCTTHFKTPSRLTSKTSRQFERDSSYCGRRRGSGT